MRSPFGHDKAGAVNGYRPPLRRFFASLAASAPLSEVLVILLFFLDVPLRFPHRCARGLLPFQRSDEPVEAGFQPLNAIHAWRVVHEDAVRVDGFELGL